MCPNFLGSFSNDHIIGKVECSSGKIKKEILLTSEAIDLNIIKKRSESVSLDNFIGKVEVF